MTVFLFRIDGISIDRADDERVGGLDGGMWLVLTVELICVPVVVVLRGCDGDIGTE
jgi:hypothetical protein